LSRGERTTAGWRCLRERAPRSVPSRTDPRWQSLAPGCLLLTGPGAVPDTEFGVSKDAGFPYFAKMAYQHREKYPTGTMGNFSRDLLPGVLMKEIDRFMLGPACECGWRDGPLAPATAGRFLYFPQ